MLSMKGLLTFFLFGETALESILIKKITLD